MLANVLKNTWKPTQSGCYLPGYRLCTIWTIHCGHFKEGNEVTVMTILMVRLKSILFCLLQNYPLWLHIIIPYYMAAIYSDTNRVKNGIKGEKHTLHFLTTQFINLQLYTA